MFIDKYTLFCHIEDSSALLANLFYHAEMDKQLYSKAVKSGACAHSPKVLVHTKDLAPGKGQKEAVVLHLLEAQFPLYAPRELAYEGVQ